MNQVWNTVINQLPTFSKHPKKKNRVRERNLKNKERLEKEEEQLPPSMAGLQRSNISFRRQGSSGIVWDDRLIAELNKQANDQKGETDHEQEVSKEEQTAGGGIKPIRTEVGGIERSRSNGGGGGANRHHRNTGRVSPAVDPPSPRLSAFGCCSAFGKKPVKQRKRPHKRRSQR